MASQVPTTRTQEAFTNGMQGKLPIWFDSHFGSIEKTERMKLCQYVARVDCIRDAHVSLRKAFASTCPYSPRSFIMAYSPLTDTQLRELLDTPL